SSAIILGHGLKSFDFWQLSNIKTEYLGGTEPTGISDLKYEQNSFVDNDILIQGLYYNATEGNKLILEGQGEIAIDSVKLDSGKQSFKLSHRLKTPGKYVLGLLEKDSLDRVISRNPLPINVIATNALNILIVNSFPSFESKYLKNFLISLGHQITVRSQLSKGKYKYEYFNTARRKVPSFNQESLKQYDLLIIDINSFNGLSRNASRSLKSSIQEDGLGLFVQPNDKFYKSFNPMISLKFNSDGRKETELENFSRTFLEKYPYRFSNEFKLEPILASSSGILTAYMRLGNGRIGSTVLQNTYQLILKGNSSIYQHIWANSITSLSKKTVSSTSWDTPGIVAFKDEPFAFELRTNIKAPVVTIGESIIVPIKRDRNISSLWKGKTYPRKIGWNQLRIEQDSISTLHYYVTDSLKWTSLKAFDKIRSNRFHFRDDTVAENIENEVKQPIDLLWFFFFFLISIGYLWLEPKL
ncbi:MAG: hypothetical protein KJP09_04150, partial [Bacteroidia bacterium]|nr:hypothetical protein [Bacteroidia bacterium]